MKEISFSAEVAKHLTVGNLGVQVDIANKLRNMQLHR